jgi:hypothetical protein
MVPSICVVRLSIARHINSTSSRVLSASSLGRFLEHLVQPTKTPTAILERHNNLRRAQLRPGQAVSVFLNQ